MFENQDKNFRPENCETCPATGYQMADVCVPVSVEPFAKAGKPVIYCYGEPTVCSGHHKCKGKPCEKCEFTISQKVCVKVPVDFGATAFVGKSFIDAGEASVKDLCHGCKPQRFDLM